MAGEGPVHELGIAQDLLDLVTREVAGPPRRPGDPRQAALVVEPVGAAGAGGTPHGPDFEPERARRHARAANPRLTFFELSCRNGEGLEPRLGWVEARLRPAPARAIVV